MKPEVVYFLNYVKTKILPKYGLDEDTISINEKKDYFEIEYLIGGRTFEDISNWYPIASKLHEEVSNVCYVTTRKKLDNIVINSDTLKGKNLLNLV
jgi:hypothetical protein